MHEILNLKLFETKNMDADISVLIALMLNQWRYYAIGKSIVSLKTDV
jgi:hypothetical protein